MDVEGEPAASDHSSYVRMLHTLSRFGDGSRSLKECIDDLRPLIDGLRDADADWKDRFSELWAELEHVFDRCVERQSLLTNDEYLYVAEIAKEMKAMVVDVVGWSEDEKAAIKLIIEDRRKDLTPGLDAGFAAGFSSEQAMGIRDAVREEVAENGYLMGKRDDWGELLEGFIDRLALS